MPNSLPNKPHVNATSWVFMLILSALMAFTSLSVDIYLPAMPAMAHDLKGNVELTITSFLIGFALAQLFWGPISDRIGRKRPLFLGVALFVIGSVGCAMSHSIEQIVFWRIIQAFGACTGPILARAMIRDLYAKTQAAQMLSTLTIVMTVAPIAGPLIGGQMVKFSTWHSIFWLLAIIGSITFFALFLLPETHTVERRHKHTLSQTLINYYHLLSQWQFMRYVLCVTFFYTAVYTFLVGSPFIYINYYGVNAQQYSILFSLNILGVMALSVINKKLIARFSLHQLLKLSTLIATCAIGLLTVLYFLHLTQITSVVILIFFFFSMNGMIAANCIAAALDNVPQVAGAASALIGSLQYGSGIISSLLFAWLSNGTPMAMILLMCVFTILSMVMVFIPNRSVES